LLKVLESVDGAIEIDLFDEVIGQFDFVQLLLVVTDSLFGLLFAFLMDYHHLDV
jgi:hypothetical protein